MLNSYVTYEQGFLKLVDGSYDEELERSNGYW